VLKFAMQVIKDLSRLVAHLCWRRSAMPVPKHP